MIDNNNLIKLFVRVPNGVSFNGAEVSAATGNEKKIYFDENDQILWVRGLSFGLTADQGTALATLIGSDKNKSVREIAQEVVNNVMDWQSTDANTVIDTLKEVLTWFNNLPEGDAGALALVNSVGHPTEYYTAQEAAAYNTEHAEDPGFESVSEGDVKTAGTGLYAMVENAVAGGLTSAGAKSGELLVNASTVGNKVEVESTTKLQNAVSAAETSIQSVSIAGVNATVSGNPNEKAAEITKLSLQGALFTNTYESSPLSYTYLGVTVSLKESNGELTYLNVDPSVLENRVTTLEEFDPWEEYSAPAQDPEP
ncbi:hypothetical protein IKN40_07040 [bacterium]|nr:hypothetical protein [bacterium]